MPTYNQWWLNEKIADLGWDKAIVQFGHHSYTPEKDCNNCRPNTWHWDNISIDPSVPFTIISADQRWASEDHGASVAFKGPAPAGSHLRFAGIGAISALASMADPAGRPPSPNPSAATKIQTACSSRTGPRCRPAPAASCFEAAAGTGRPGPRGTSRSGRWKPRARRNPAESGEVGPSRLTPATPRAGASRAAVRRRSDRRPRTSTSHRNRRR